MFNIGEEVGVTKLRNAYDAYVLQVIGNRFERVERERTSKRRPSAKYKVTSELPNQIEYTRLKSLRFNTDVESACEEAASEVESLASEVRDWYDNLGENLQQSDKAQRLEEAADTLEGVDIPERPNICSYIEFVRYPALDIGSRAKRAGEAADCLRTSANAVREWIEYYRAKDSTDDDSTMTVAQGAGQTKEIEFSWSDLESFINDCDSAADELEGVEFPGMY